MKFVSCFIENNKSIRVDEWVVRICIDEPPVFMSFISMQLNFVRLHSFSVTLLTRSNCWEGIIWKFHFAFLLGAFGITISISVLLQSLLEHHLLQFLSFRIQVELINVILCCDTDYLTSRMGEKCLRVAVDDMVYCTLYHQGMIRKKGVNYRVQYNSNSVWLYTRCSAWKI